MSSPDGILPNSGAPEERAQACLPPFEFHKRIGIDLQISFLVILLKATKFVRAPAGEQITLLSTIRGHSDRPIPQSHL